MISSHMILLLSPLHFFLFLLLSSAYSNFTDNHFINCGSDTNTSFGRDRVFFGDINYHGSLSINPGKSLLVKDNNVSKDIPELYHTARVYSIPTWYVLRINRDGKFIVRLHFFPLTSLKSNLDLAKAQFSVSVPGYRLISNFTVNSKKPVIYEFWIPIEERDFGFYFEPSMESSFAFVNAIEVINASELFFPEKAYQVNPFSDADDETVYYPLQFKAMQPIYRINVGGALVNQENDSLWREWVPDDEYLVTPAAAVMNAPTYGGKIIYGVNLTDLVAPIFVYNTAKEFNTNSTITGQLNAAKITWSFKVDESPMYFVRPHFCDIISESLGQVVFTFFIYNRFNFTIDPSESSNYRLGAPFYYDMAIYPDNSGFLNISIGLHNDSINPNAFLNGLEIMELIAESEKVLVISDPKDDERLGRNKTDDRGSALWVGLVVAGVITILGISIALLFTFFGCKKLRTVSSNRTSILALDPNLNLGLKISLAEIKLATDKFNETLLLGEGGFGKVYKGTIHDKTVAVKRSTGESGQGLTEFVNEIKILSRIRHMHLVSLVGYCNDNSEMILVYEFMENGTLRDVLYHEQKVGNFERKGMKFTWNKRLEICIDAAKGLDYLHTGLSHVIIHRDVKTTNILLDKDNVAKLADFGLSKLYLPNPNHETTTGIKGTCGYWDPEYFNSAQLTEKSDVYSFGVVLLEVLSGRPPIMNNAEAKEESYLPEWAMHCRKQDRLDKLVDPSIMGSMIPHSLNKFVDIAFECLKASGLERPTMHDVIWELQYALQLQENGMLKNATDESTIVTDWDSRYPMRLQNLPSSVSQTSVLETETVKQTEVYGFNIEEVDTCTSGSAEFSDQMKSGCS